MGWLLRRLLGCVWLCCGVGWEGWFGLVGSSFLGLLLGFVLGCFCLVL